MSFADKKLERSEVSGGNFETTPLGTMHELAKLRADIERLNKGCAELVADRDSALARAERLANALPMLAKAIEHAGMATPNPTLRNVILGIARRTRALDDQPTPMPSVPMAVIPPRDQVAPPPPSRDKERIAELEQAIAICRDLGVSVVERADTPGWAVTNTRAVAVENALRIVERHASGTCGCDSRPACSDTIVSVSRAVLNERPTPQRDVPMPIIPAKDPVAPPPPARAEADAARKVAMFDVAAKDNAELRVRAEAAEAALAKERAKPQCDRYSLGLPGLEGVTFCRKGGARAAAELIHAAEAKVAAARAEVAGRAVEREQRRWTAACAAADAIRNAVMDKVAFAVAAARAEERAKYGRVLKTLDAMNNCENVVRHHVDDVPVLCAVEEPCGHCQIKMVALWDEAETVLRARGEQMEGAS